MLPVVAEVVRVNEATVLSRRNMAKREWREDKGIFRMALCPEGVAGLSLADADHEYHDE